MSKPSDLVQGTLDLLILKVLALEPLNGYSVSQRLKQVSGAVLHVSDGSLYPALHKLEQEGWIAAEWKTDRERPSREILFAYALGAQAIREGTNELGPALACNFASGET